VEELGGLAFEAVCHKHIAQIRQALAIEPGSMTASWRYRAKVKKGIEGAQI